jgi:hypothetical protein
MKLTQLLKESKLISESGLLDKAEYGRFATVVIPITGKGGKGDITFNVEIGPNPSGYAGILLDFIPKGKKMADLATEIAGFNQGLEQQKALGQQIAKWVSTKTKPFPAYEHYSPKNKCRVGLVINKLIKKIK